MDDLPSIFTQPGEPAPEQGYQCNRCAQPFRGPQTIGRSDRCPHCGALPPFAVMPGLHSASSVSAASLVLSTGIVGTSGAEAMPRLFQSQAGEHTTHGSSPDLVALVDTGHYAKGRPHIEPFAVEPLLVLGAVAIIAGTAYAGRRVPINFKPKPKLKPN
jgi:hypothetical protein